MTPSQTKSLQAHLWPAACAVQGWERKDRALRLNVLSEIVGRPLESASELNSTDDFDKVKRELERCAGSLRGALDNDQQGRERRLRHAARAGLACVTVYLGTNTAAYLRATLIKKGLFPGIDADWLLRAAVEELIEMLDDAANDKRSPLRQAVSTIWRIAYTQSRKAGDAPAAMKTKAGLTGETTGDSPF